MVATLEGEAGDDRRRQVEIEREIEQLEDLYAAPSVETVPALSRIATMDLQLGPGDTLMTSVNKRGTMAHLMGRMSFRKVGLTRQN